jgi:cell division septum initiation protein DivIVA
VVLSVVPPALGAFASANSTAGEMISSAGAADSQAMLAAAAAALGPIGANYLAAYASAQANNLDATLQVGRVHAAIGAATEAANASFVTSDEDL